MLKQAHTQKVTYQQWQKGGGIDENGKKYDLVIINKEKEVLTNSKLLSTVTEMIVNENKQYSAFKLKKNRKTYSDHNAILLKLNLVAAIET